jgi:cell wall-associated NlpC family hydrolase
MKRLLTIGALALLLASCSTSTAVQPAHASIKPKQLNIENALSKDMSATSVLHGSLVKAKQLQQQQRTSQRQFANKGKITTLVKKVMKYKGKTQWVFSGSSPRGWDCSGLVRWAYGKVGVTLDHSATRQMRSGEVVKQPMVGDIVAFYYGSGQRSFHVGLYTGNGKMVHAYNARSDTRVDSVAGVAKENWSKVKYIRILDTLPGDQQTFAMKHGQLAKVEQP